MNMMNALRRGRGARAASAATCRPFTATRILVTLALALGACSPARTLESFPCPDGGTTLTYESFGKDFLDRRCQTCHASDSPNRKGAPSSFTFGSRSDVEKHLVRIFERSAAENDTMPPGPDDPPLLQRMKLAEWLACGAP